MRWLSSPCGTQLVSELRRWLKFPEPGTPADLAAIPVGFALAGLLIFLAIDGTLGFSMRSLNPARIERQATHWWRCGGSALGSPVWSHDGSRIAFVKQGKCGTQVYVLTVRTGRVHQLTTGNFDSYPSWSSNDRWVVFSGSGGIYRVPASGGTAQELVHEESDFGATVSPVGELAYTHGSLPGPGGDLQTSVYRTQGRATHRVAGHSVNAGTPAWSPNGREIAMAGVDGLYTVRPNGTRLRQLLKRYFGFNPPTVSWSPDSRRIAFVEVEEGVYVVDLDGTHLRRITRFPCISFGDAVAFAPSGRWIVYTKTCGNAQGVYLLRPDGTRQERILGF
jgi:Tol biopolymer transport system component